MKTKFHRGIFYYIPQVQFESKFSIDESIDRLTKVSRSFYRSHINLDDFEPKLSGHVMKDDVALHRHDPAVHWTGRPYFIGKFVTRDNKVFLDGCFRVTVLEGISYIIGYVMTVVIFSAFLLGLAFGEPDANTRENKWIMFGFLAAISSLVYLFNWISRNWVARDIEWISDHIKKALGA